MINSTWHSSTQPKNKAEAKQVEKLIDWGRQHCHPNFRIDYEITTALKNMRVKSESDPSSIETTEHHPPLVGTRNLAKFPSTDSMAQLLIEDYQPDQITAENTRKNSNTKLPGPPTTFRSKSTQSHVIFVEEVEVGSLRKFIPTKPLRFIVWREKIKMIPNHY